MGDTEQWVKFGPGMYEFRRDGARVASLQRGFGRRAKWSAVALTSDEWCASRQMCSREAGFDFCEFATINPLETVNYYFREGSKEVDGVE